MAAPGPVLLRIDGAVAAVTLARPERRNAADRDMLAALEAAIDQAEGAGEVRLLTVTGAGSAFCAGWDVADLSRLASLDAEQLAAEFAANARVLDRFSTSPLPTLALVNGPVAGFGVSLVARADFAIAAEHATFHLPEAALGIVPALVAEDLVAALGRRAAFDWLALADRRSAAAALAAGLVRQVVPGTELAAQADALAAALAAAPRGVLAELKGLTARLAADADADARRRLVIAGAVAALQARRTQDEIQRKNMKAERENDWQRDSKTLA